jgi:drug/metabolite transporter (DMT)-like permease
VSPLNLLRLITLAACWGIAFVFVRVAVPYFGPVALVDVRVLTACAVLVLYARIAGIRLDFVTHWRRYAMVGVLNSALPFCLVALAQSRMSVAYAVILVSVTPLVSAVIAAVWIKDPFSFAKGIGLVLGIAGVALLLGWTPDGAEAPASWAVACALAATISYGTAGVYTKRYCAHLPALEVAAGSQLASGLLLLPLVAVFPPHGWPPPLAWANALALAVFGTALAFLLYFRLIVNVGPVKALTVNFLAPLFGVSGGILLLGETASANVFLGAAVILIGTGLVIRSGAR